MWKLRATALLILSFATTSLVAQQGATTQIRTNAGAPSSCSPTKGDIFFHTSATVTLGVCTATNTWDYLVRQSRTITATSPLTGGGDLSADRSIGCQTASALQDGCLSSTDWTTFNNKGSGTITGSGTTGRIPKFSSSTGLTDSGMEQVAGSIRLDRGFSLVFQGGSTGSAAIVAATAAGNPAFLVLPTATAGGNGYLLASDGSSPQQLSWVAPGSVGSGGTVTNVATSGPITGGPITTTGTIDCPGCTTASNSQVFTNKGYDTAGSGNAFAINGNLITAVKGNTATVQLQNGSTSTNDCAKFDSNGNVVSAGAPCGTGSGSGSVTSVATSAPVSGGTITTTGTISLSGPPNVTTLTNHGVVVGQATSPVAATTAGAAGSVLVGQGASADPSFQAIAATSPVTVASTGGTITIACPTCQIFGPTAATKGGFVGGCYQTTATSLMMPFQCGVTQTVPALPVPDDVWLAYWNGCLPATIFGDNIMSIGLQSLTPALTFDTSAISGLPVNTSSTGRCGGNTTNTFHLSQGTYWAAKLVSSGGTLQNMTGWSAGVLGSRFQPLGSGVGTVGGAAGTTHYVGFEMDTNFSNTEQQHAFPLPFAGTFTTLVASNSTGQPATGTQTYTLDLNTVAQSLVATITANRGIGHWYGTGSVANAAGDWVAVAVKNNSSGTGANTQQVAASWTPTAPGRAVMGFGPPAGTALNTNAHNYFPPYASRNPNATETAVWGSIPDAATLTAIACFVIAAPSVGPVSIDIYKNGVSQGTVMSITSAQGANTVQLVTGLSIAFAQFDAISLDMHTAATGTAGTIPRCVPGFE